MVYDSTNDTYGSRAADDLVIVVSSKDGHSGAGGSWRAYLSQWLHGEALPVSAFIEVPLQTTSGDSSPNALDRNL
jgi:hypothetical protein